MDETLLGHKPFLVIAAYLARRGVAVLRVDDRGVGKSTGNSTRATIDNMSGDVLAGINFLKGRKEIDAKHIGVNWAQRGRFGRAAGGLAFSGRCFRRDAGRDRRFLGPGLIQTG